MDNVFSLIMMIVVSIILAIPFGGALLYIGLGLRQIMIGDKENSRFKQKGGKKALVVASVVLVCIILFWFWCYRLVT